MFARFSQKWLTLVYYMGFGLVAIMFAQAQFSTDRASHAVGNSVHQQEFTRNLIWINLLMQRSANLAIVGVDSGNPAGLEQAKTIADSLSDYAPSDATEDGKLIVRDIEEFQAAVRTLAKRGRNYSDLLKITDKIGTELNRIETKTWYELEDHNSKVVSEIHKGYRTLLAIVFLFFGYLGFLGWILRRKRLAEAALVDAEARSLNNAKMSALGEMAGGIAHEINTPLATIMITSEQALECLGEEPFDAVLAAEMLKTINATAGRIAVVIKGLRTFSRDGSRDQFTVYPLKHIIDDVKQLCSERFRHSGVQFDVDATPNGLMLNCQPIQVSQVLLNLLNNAFDAVQSLTEKWIRISVKSEGSTVRISVTDSGSGIPPEVKAKMFQPFFTTKQVGKGTGIGLSISKGIIDAHNGTLSLDSTCEKTCFVISLPRAAGTEKKAA